MSKNNYFKGGFGRKLEKTVGAWTLDILQYNRRQRRC